MAKENSRKKYTVLDLAGLAEGNQLYIDASLALLNDFMTGMKPGDAFYLTLGVESVLKNLRKENEELTNRLYLLSRDERPLAA